MNDTQELGQAIRELLDSYVPPPDPFVSVARRVRLRRIRRIHRVAAGVVAAVSLAVTLAVVVAAAPSGGVTVQRVDVATASPLVATGDQFVDFGPGRPLGPAYVVTRGSVNGRAYVVASTTFGMAEAACLFAKDAVFDRLSWCSSASQRGQVGEWDLLGAVRADADVVAVGGIVEANVQTVIIRTSDGLEQAVPAVRTPTSSRVAFFAGILPGTGAQVAAVLATGSNGRLTPVKHARADAACPDGQPLDPQVAGDAVGCSAEGAPSVERRS
jgi:hypothetical protein